MVRRTLKAITAKISGLHEAAFWLAGFSVLSQILAFVRDRLLAHYFGAGQALDVYYAAFRIPDFIFVTLGSLVSISVLVPMFSRKAAENEASVRPYVDSIFTSFALMMVLSCAAVFFVMPQLVPVLFKGLLGESLDQVIKFSRILLLSPLLLGFSNFLGSIVQYEKRFLLYSLSPLFYNGGIILGIALGASNFGIEAAVWGVVSGASLHLLVPVLYMVFGRSLPRFTKKIKWNELKETIAVSVPRALALSATQIITIIFTALAAFFGPGAIAVFNLGFNLQSVPLSIIGVSYSLAAFPTLSEHYAKKNISECGRYIGESLRFIIFWLLPLSALFIILRSHIVRAILGTGEFDWTDTKLTAAVLSLFALSFVFQSMQLFLTRAHYALGKTKTPLLIGLLGAGATVAFVFLLNLSWLSGVLSFFESFLEVESLPGSKIIILPLSFSLGSLLTASGLWLFLSAETKAIAKQGMPKTVLQSVLAAAIVSAVTFFSLRLFDDFLELGSLLGVVGHAVLSGLAGIAVAVVVLLLLKNRELREILGKFRHG